MTSKASPRQRTLVFILILLGIGFTTFFGMRSFRAYKKFDGHRPPPPGKPGEVETDVELIRDWMTISFISKTYRVPEKDIFDAIQITPLGNHEKSLKDLNHEYYPDADGFVLETVKAEVKKLQPAPLPDSTTNTDAPPITTTP
jgi:hypothetical protein